MTDVGTSWLWIGFAGMAIGALLLGALGRSARSEDKHHFVASAFVCLVASVAYFTMANGQGIVRAGEEEVYVARYADWLITTPLLLVGLLTIGLPRLKPGDDVRSRNALVGGVLGADALMIITGLLAALSTDDTVKYTFYAISCGFFLAVLGLVFGPVRQQARASADPEASLLDTLGGTLTVLWFIYPILWLLGTEGTGVISLSTEIAVFTIVDLAAKVGFGALLCTRVLAVHRGAPATAGATRTSGSTARA